MVCIQYCLCPLFLQRELAAPGSARASSVRRPFDDQKEYGLPEFANPIAGIIAIAAGIILVIVAVEVIDEASGEISGALDITGDFTNNGTLNRAPLRELSWLMATWF